MPVSASGWTRPAQGSAQAHGKRYEHCEWVKEMQDFDPGERSLCPLIVKPLTYFNLQL